MPNRCPLVHTWQSMLDSNFLDLEGTGSVNVRLKFRRGSVNMRFNTNIRMIKFEGLDLNSAFQSQWDIVFCKVEMVSSYSQV